MLDVKSLYNPKYAKSFRRSTAIDRAGSNGGMYILLSGDVGVYKSYGTKNETLVATETPGGFFGDTGFFLDKAHSFSFIALTEVMVLEINRKNVNEFFKLNPDTAFEIARTICARMDALNKDGLYSGAVIQAKIEEPPPAATSPTANTVNADAAGHGTAGMLDAPAGKQEPKPAESVKESARNNSVNDNADSALKRPPGVLLPEGHGDYKLPFAGSDGEFIFEKTMTCPMCRNGFKASAIKSYRLVAEQTDPDLRVHYKGVDPTYYDVITCPACLYSALSDMFPTGAKSKEFIAKKLDGHKAEFEAAISAKNADCVFIKYYLALICTPLCFRNPQLAIAKLWLKMSRLYADCQDEKMEMQAIQNAHEAYMYSYEKLSIPANQNQQLCTMIGETGLRLRKYKTAKDFFFKAKIDIMGIKLLKDHADDRINDLRKMELAEPLTDQEA